MSFDNISVGRFTSSHSLKGEMKFVPFEYWFEIIKDSVDLYDSSGNALKVYFHGKDSKGLFRVSLEGCDSIDKTADFLGKDLFVLIKDLPELPEGLYYKHELLGLKVFKDDSDDVYGSVIKVDDGPLGYVMCIKDICGNEEHIALGCELLYDISPKKGYMRICNYSVIE